MGHLSVQHVSMWQLIEWQLNMWHLPVTCQHVTLEHVTCQHATAQGLTAQQVASEHVTCQHATSERVTISMWQLSDCQLNVWRLTTWHVSTRQLRELHLSAWTFRRACHPIVADRHLLEIWHLTTCHVSIWECKSSVLCHAVILLLTSCMWPHPMLHFRMRAFLGQIGGSCRWRVFYQWHPVHIPHINLPCLQSTVLCAHGVMEIVGRVAGNVHVDLCAPFTAKSTKRYEAPVKACRRNVWTGI